jgi:predicted lipoprotein
VFPGRIDGALGSSRPIDDSFLGEVSATTKGMFALEYVLFAMPGNQPTQGKSTSSEVLSAFLGPESLQRRQYATVVARDLAAKASQLAKDWTATGAESASGKLVAGGQQSLNVLINQLALFVEQTTEQRLHFILLLPAPIANQLDRIEASRSGMSQQSLVAVLQGAQKLYRSTDGLGLDGYVKQLNASLAERFARQFDAAIAACQAIGAPLEKVVPDNRAIVERAYEQTHALEVLCKTELASALGVTLTFSGNDND